MNFKQPIGESLTTAINMAHRLQDSGANIATITDALIRAGFSETIQTTIRTLISSELKEGYKPKIRYQEPLSYNDG